MLEYRENIDYGQEPEPSLDDLIEELREACALDADAGVIYDAVHASVMREIRTSELAITVIMPDLLEMLERNPRKARLVMLLLADPYASYSELGEKMGYSKQRTSVILHELSGRYDWLRRVLTLHNCD